MPEQFLFVSNRNITISSTLGYNIEFKRGVPTHVPKRMHAQVMEKGILPCDEKGALRDAPVASAPTEGAILVAPEDGDERAAAIEKVLHALVDRNNPKDFSAGGVPTASSVSAALGWKVDAKEIRPVWDKVKRGDKE